MSSGTYALAFWYAGQLVGSGENTFDEVLKVGSFNSCCPHLHLTGSRSRVPPHVYHSFLWQLPAPGRPPLLTV